MAQSWYAQTGGSIRGPLDARSLKALADTGQLKPSDQVRQGDAGKWISAQQVSGLFNNTRFANASEPGAAARVIEPPSPSSSVDRNEQSRSTSLRRATLVAIISIILALSLDLAQFFLVGFQDRFDHVFYDRFSWLLARFKFYVGFGGLLYFLFVLRAKQSR